LARAKRRGVNILMLGLTGLMTGIAILPLVWILVSVFIRGSQFITLGF
jgi:ABC-type phosphate transport system permease subunit